MSRISLSAVAVAVVALAAGSAVALVGGAVLVSFASAAGKLLGLALVLAALAGFALASWLATDRPQQHGAAAPRRSAHVSEQRWGIPGVGRSPWGQRIPPAGQLGRKQPRSRR